MTDEASLQETKISDTTSPEERDLDKDVKYMLAKLEDALYLPAHDVLVQLDAELHKLTQQVSLLPTDTNNASLRLQTDENVPGASPDEVSVSPSGSAANGTGNHTQERLARLQRLFQQHAEQIDKLRVRYKEVMETLHYEDNPADWTFGTSYFGITTHYKVDSSDNSLVLKLEGVLEDLPLFEQCAVIHEVDLFPSWLPFCREGKLIEKLGIAELIPYIYIYMPPLGRDFILHAYGADCLDSHGQLLILGKSVDCPNRHTKPTTTSTSSTSPTSPAEPAKPAKPTGSSTSNLTSPTSPTGATKPTSSSGPTSNPTKPASPTNNPASPTSPTGPTRSSTSPVVHLDEEAPNKPSNPNMSKHSNPSTDEKYSQHYRAASLWQNKMFVKEFRTMTHILSPSRAKTTIIADIDPNTVLPQYLLNLVIKNLAGMVLYFFQRQVRKIATDPRCEHAARIRGNRAFYQDWVLRKLERMCQQRGWVLPPIHILDDPDKADDEDAAHGGKGQQARGKKKEGWLW